MIQKLFNLRSTGWLAAILLFVAGTPTLVADQITILFVNAGFETQEMTLDCNSSPQDLALAASLFGEDGVRVSYEPGEGCSLADIASAMANAAPLFAANVAQTLSLLSPDNKAAIVAAVNAVPGVNTVAVLSAVYFGPYRTTDGPQAAVFGSSPRSGLRLIVLEAVPSGN